jgi:hypothetical protein
MKLTGRGGRQQRIDRKRRHAGMKRTGRRGMQEGSGQEEEEGRNKA